ncbi:MAG: MaoC family dehydratase [Bacillota bacterium]
MQKTKLALGDSVQTKKQFSSQEVEQFSNLSGDRNPLHLEENYAAKTIFKKRVVHGSLVNSLFSNLLGNHLPGEGTIYCKQDSKFLKPVYIGEEITAVVEVIEIDAEKNRVFLDTSAYNQSGEKVIAGKALVLPPKGMVS